MGDAAGEVRLLNQRGVVRCIAEQAKGQDAHEASVPWSRSPVPPASTAGTPARSRLSAPEVAPPMSKAPSPSGV